MVRDPKAPALYFVRKNARDSKKTNLCVTVYGSGKQNNSGVSVHDIGVFLRKKT